MRNAIGSPLLTTYTSPTINSTYSYDCDGLCSSVTRDGAQTDTWDTATSSLPLLLSDGGGDYLHGPGDQAIEQIDSTSGTVTYLQHDQIGSTRTLTDQNGDAVGSCSYDAYGRQLTHTGDATTILGYTGQQTDPTGLVYLHARYYDPGDAQFLNVDPMRDFSDASYAYADADPLDEVDPAGDLPYVDDLVDGGNTPAHNKAVTMAAAQLELRPELEKNVYADVTGWFSTGFHEAKSKLKFLNNPAYEPDIVAYDQDTNTYYIYEVKPYSTKGLASSSIAQVRNYVKVGSQCLGGTVKLGPSSYIVPETQEWGGRWITIFPRAEDHKFVENVFKNNKDYTGLVFYIQTGKNPRKQMYKVKHQSGGFGRIAHDVGQGASTAGRGIAVAAGATASAINSAYSDFENFSESQPELAGLE
jgi:RHS repeat-associated protein